MQPERTPFLIWNQSVVPCPGLTVASWPTYKFCRRQVRWLWYSHLIKNFPVCLIHTVKGFGIVNKAEIEVFLELLLFWWSRSSLFSLAELAGNCWLFLVSSIHVLPTAPLHGPCLWPDLEQFLIARIPSLPLCLCNCQSFEKILVL